MLNYLHGVRTYSIFTSNIKNIHIMKETTYNKIEFLIDQIEKDIRWHDSEIKTAKSSVVKGAHIGASSALVQVVNRLYDILQK